MIEDKFGAELLGLQLPVSSLGCLPPLRAAKALAALAGDASLPLIRVPHTLLLSPSPPSRLGKLWDWDRPADPSPGLSQGGPAGRSSGWSSQWHEAGLALCAPPSLPLPTLLQLSPHQPVARLRCSVPAPSWSLPHLPTPTGRSTGGKRAPGPPDQTAPAVLLKVRGT